MVSSALAFLALVGVLLLPVLIIKALKGKNLKEEKIKNKCGVLYENYKTERLKTSSFEVYKLLRKLIFAVGLVFFQDDSLKQ